MNYGYLVMDCETDRIIDWCDDEKAALDVAKSHFEETENETWILKPIARVYDKNKERDSEMAVEDL